MELIVPFKEKVYLDIIQQFQDIHANDAE